MMNDTRDLDKEEKPQPGKTIVLLEGEVLSVQFTQWGIIGKLKTQYGIYSYKLKDSNSLSSNLAIGFKLIINNGYCFENKKGETVVSDGKFGNIKTMIDKSFYEKVEGEVEVVTGAAKSIDILGEKLCIHLEQIVPPGSIKEIMIINSENDVISNLKEKPKSFINKIVTIEGKGDLVKFHIIGFKLLPENHFLNKIINIKNGNLEEISLFNHIILEQIEYIENVHENFRNILLNMGKEVSKTLLSNLKEVLLDKILRGKVEFPYNILISQSDIEKYFNSMIVHTRDVLYSNENIRKPEDLIIFLKYYYPTFTYDDKAVEKLKKK